MLKISVWTFASSLALSTWASSSQEPLVSPQADWDSLKSAVGGRLFEGTPFAHPCFTQGFASQACQDVRSKYLDEVTRASSPSAYIQTQWETCQSNDDQCLLSYEDPNDPRPSLPPRQCQLGSIPEHFSPDDVAAAFQFVQKTKVPLVIKNTGHDYKGRSSAPHSLALWVDLSLSSQFLQQILPPTLTTRIHRYPITLLLFRWVALEPKEIQQLLSGVVTPDGHYRIANECRNTDLFYALRGGGGGTFGVVLEATIMASPPVTLQAVIVSFTPDTTHTQELWNILADNGLKWADEGWGGFSTSGVAILINPGSNKEDAAKSMDPLIQFGKRLKAEGVEGIQFVVTEFPSWGTFFETFTKEHVAVVGSSLALASRLISKQNFETPSSRSALVSGLLAADEATPGLIILISAPSSFPSTGKTSVTDAWRSSVYHVTVVSPWEWDATAKEKLGNYTAVSRSIDHLRKITPDAAYLVSLVLFQIAYSDVWPFLEE
ncbi:hypothetical protein DXG01_008111 [Tephrocybe rancida]|nr:hypothetical protein DXG01_008111 [Tephrocybe rancida]